MSSVYLKRIRELTLEALRDGEESDLELEAAGARMAVEPEEEIDLMYLSLELVTARVARIMSTVHPGGPVQRFSIVRPAIASPHVPGLAYKPLPHPIKVGVHPSSNGKIIVSYPGWCADIDGYNSKYFVLAEWMRSRLGAAVVRANNPYIEDFDYPTAVVNNLKAVLKFCVENSRAICGVDHPELNLLGFSAGASAITALASQYPQVTRVLLMAPSRDADAKVCEANLPNYRGEVYIVVGENDDVVGASIAPYFADLAQGASRVETRVIPDCDHQFRGGTNGKVMSSAPLWAFGDGFLKEPSPEFGIKLYD